VTGDGARSGDVEGITSGRGDGVRDADAGALPGCSDGVFATGHSRIFRVGGSEALAGLGGLEALGAGVSCHLTRDLTVGVTGANRALILAWVVLSALVSFGATFFGAGPGDEVLSRY
jgi:hypothetical protein